MLGNLQQSLTFRLSVISSLSPAVLGTIIHISIIVSGKASEELELTPPWPSRSHTQA